MCAATDGVNGGAKVGARGSGQRLPVHRVRSQEDVSGNNGPGWFTETLRLLYPDSSLHMVAVTPAGSGSSWSASSRVTLRLCPGRGRIPCRGCFLWGLPPQT